MYAVQGKGSDIQDEDLVNENKWAHPRKVSQMLCAKGPIMCPDRPILLSSKATHFALNSVSLFSLSLLTSGNCCENLTCHGKRGGGGEGDTIIPSRNNTSDTPRYFMIEKQE